MRRTPDKRQQVTCFTVKPTTTQLRTAKLEARRGDGRCLQLPKSEEMRREKFKKLTFKTRLGKQGNFYFSGFWLRLSPLVMKWPLVRPRDWVTQKTGWLFCRVQQRHLAEVG